MSRPRDKPDARTRRILEFTSDAATALQLDGFSPDDAWRIAGEFMIRKVNEAYRRNELRRLRWAEERARRAGG